MAIKENSQILSEERQMEVNVSYERYRKALIRAAQEYKYMIESVGKSIYVLQRHTCKVSVHSKPLYNERTDCRHAFAKSEACANGYG